MAAKYKIEDVQEYAANYGGKCLSKEYIDVSTPLKWQCAKGHTWEADFQIIRQGGWCKQCQNQKKKEQYLEDVKAIAAKKKMKCLSSEYINDNTKLQFQCEAGHVWWASPNNIKHGSWCRKCADKLSGLKKRDSLKTYQRIANEHGGKCLSTVYILSTEPLEFQCAKGHIWKTMAMNVKTGRWCPKCSYEYRQALHRDSIELYQKIAKEHGGKCLSTVYIKSTCKLEFQCKEGHTWTTTAIGVKQGSWCPKCGNIITGLKQRDSIETFYKIAKEHGGKCISTEYTNSNVKLLFQCSEGHQFSASPVKIKIGQWCRICGMKNRVYPKKYKRLKFKV